jgi:hypothetical protein
MFTERPFVGAGLETFGIHYSSFRPQGAAERFENSITSSAHSIPLGMFANGGLLLGLAFLCFLCVVSYSGVCTLMRFREVPVSSIAMVFAWVALVIQSLVSVEHVGIFTLMFFIGGCVVWDMKSLDAVSSTSRAFLRRRNTDNSDLGWVGLGVLLVIVLAPLVLAKPLLSNMAIMDAFQAQGAGDLQAAIESSDRAVNAADWNSQAWVYLAEFSSLSGDYGRAAEAASRALSLSNYSSSIVDPMSRILVGDRRYEESREAWRLAIVNDPFALQLREKALAFFAEAANALEQVGVVDEAQKMRDASTSVLTWAETSKWRL